jgi:SulP family sulfate permease
VGLKRVGPRIPAALIAIVAATLAVGALSLDARGVRLVGEIPRSLPPPTWVTTGSLPGMDLIQGLVMGAMAVTALGLIEAVAASQTLSRRAGDRLDFNQEFFGQGLANIATGLFSGYPCSGSFTRSALAQQSGARTHLTGVFTGLTVLGGILVLAPWAGRIPRSAIAGVLLVVAWRMVEWEGIGRVFRTSRAESTVMVVTFVRWISPFRPV